MEKLDQDDPKSYDFSLLNEAIDKIFLLDAKIEGIMTCYLLKPWSLNENWVNLKAEIQNDLKSLAVYKDKGDDFNILVKISNETNNIYRKYSLFYNNLSKKTEKFFLQVDFDFKYCYGFSSDKEINLIVYNLERGKKEKVLVEELKCLDCNSCLIRLPNNELFCYGNKGSPYYGTSHVFIIDLKTFAIKKVLPSWNLCLGIGGIYLENTIIVFGGYRKRDFLVECSQFDLLKQKWTQLPPILADSYHISCIAFRDTILLSGFGHKKIYQYDLRIQSCSEICTIDLNPLKLKSLTTGNSRAYVFEYNGRIFESQIEDEYKWSLIGNLPNEKLIHLKLYDQSLIFAEATKTEKATLYKFELIAKELKKISY